MVLEYIFNPFVLKKKPWEMFLVGFTYSIIALFLSYLVFKEVSGLLTVFLIVIAILPTMYITIKNEEELDIKYESEWKLLQEHAKVITFLVCMFLGITTALAVSYVFLPHTMVDSVFEFQQKAIVNVNNYVRGNIVGDSVTAQVTKTDIFIKIFLNNLKVLFFCLIFSLLYGTGALFILTWNASVIAAAMGNVIKTKIAESASLAGFSLFSAYFSTAAFGFFKYMIHGILEITAYFIIALAGGILSMALIKKDLSYDAIMTDVLDLVLISIGFLLVGGIVEVYVTPLLFS
ncbi:MAG TPA: stage II sporulation protein M [Candidatus Nanoarchaeia archaeon]|nr:stage II sporulation protein M [Candidatus Nanoarchaeia archaeon]